MKLLVTMLGATIVVAVAGCGTCDGADLQPAETASAPVVTVAAPDVVVGAPASGRCFVGQGTGGAAAYRMVVAFPELRELEQPIDMVGRGGRIYVAERAGRVLSFDPRRAAEVETVVDLRGRVHTEFECGLLGLALHPRFVDNGVFFLDYCEKKGGVTRSVIARWTLRPGAEPLEEVLITQVQPWDNHNGGSLAFGPDGHLYVGFGDGGSSNDPRNAGQDPDTLLGKILRIDVDTATDVRDGARAYRIPADNPFASGGGRPEIFAWGMRNPWRMSFDRLTGELWVGDVGQNAREEIDIVERGKNYGWRVMEGTLCRPGGPRSCDQDGLALPVLEYPHDQGRSITGGFVYRGTKVPALVGRYVYADFVTRAVWAWRRGDPAPTSPLFTAPAMIASFGEDEDGELYALGLDTGRIYRIEPDPAGLAAPPPARLSETGCFDVATGAPSLDLVPYDVALPFWSDGADKRRWFVLPAGGRITPRDDAPWHFPVGSLFVKSFYQSASGDGVARPIETRFLVQHDDGVRGFTYRWNEDGRDATLLADAVRTDTWHYPSPAECVTCHNGRGPLGLTSAQLGTQPEAWSARGLIDGTWTSVAAHPRLGDEAVPVERRARAWLEVNCAYCHRGPTGPSGTAMDLGRSAPLGAMQVCNIGPQREDLGDPAMRRVVPGAHAKSLVHARAARRDVLGMPPLATLEVDAVGLGLVARWIDGLQGCP